MARFHFTLETVLRQRERTEQAAQRNLAIARQALVPLEEKLRELDTLRKNADDDLRSRLVGPINLNFIGGHRRFIVSLETQVLAVAKEMAAAQILVDKAQAALMLAARAKKAIETLREKQLERFNEAQAKIETDNLDEAGMQIAYHNLTEDQDAS